MRSSLQQFPPRPGEEGATALVRAAFPPRKNDSHKGDYGSARLCCGSARYPGAALLAAEACARVGAGLTTLAAPAFVCAAAVCRLPDITLRPMPAFIEEPEAYEAFLGGQGERPGAALVGCGLGHGDGTPQGTARARAVLYRVIATQGDPLVMDADALNLLSCAREASLVALDRAARPIILTPHPMEFSRLSGLSVSEIQAGREEVASAFARRHHLTLVLKGAGTVVANEDGQSAVVPAGSPALAKGGSGDVLAGCLCGLLAMGILPASAAFVAACLHGRAGEELARAFSEYGVLPSDLPAAIARQVHLLCPQT